MFETVTHYFPVRSYSFLPCGRDFRSIKLIVRKAYRVHRPNQYTGMILKASKTGRLTLHKVKSNMIIAFSSWWPQFYKKTVNSGETCGRGVVAKEEKKTFKVSTYKEFKYKHG